jgi:hypothetical protein
MGRERLGGARPRNERSPAEKRRKEEQVWHLFAGIAVSLAHGVPLPLDNPKRDLQCRLEIGEEGMPGTVDRPCLSFEAGD